MTGFLDGLRVLDFSHMLAGPMAARRLADFGARVVKVEPKGGEGLRTRGRPIDIVDGDHLRFHAYNAGKQSIELDLGDDADRAVAHRLAGEADVLVQNFRPDVLAKFGLGYEQLRATNPGLIYASVSGYGGQGEWRAEPGQDLLAQARSGLMWLTGRRDDPPMPVGGVVADIAAANILAQGILAALVGRAKTGRGALVETSLLEAGVDLQIDCLPMFLNRREGRPQRSASGGAHAYVDAPYAVYRTADGFIAVAMLSEEALRQMIGDFAPPASASWEEARDLNIEALAKVFVTQPTAHWLDYVSAHKGWAAKVLDWDELIASPGFQGLEMLTPKDAPRQAVVVAAPLRFDGRRPRSEPAPRLNDHGERLRREGWG